MSLSTVATFGGYKSHFTSDGDRTLCGREVSNGTSGDDMCKRCDSAAAKLRAARERLEYGVRQAETQDDVMSQAAPIDQMYVSQQPEAQAAQQRLSDAMATLFKPMAGTVRTDGRGLRYRVERVSFKGARRFSEATVCVSGRVIDRATDKYGESLYDAYASEVFRDVPEQDTARAEAEQSAPIMADWERDLPADAPVRMPGVLETPDGFEWRTVSEETGELRLVPVGLTEWELELLAAADAGEIPMIDPDSNVGCFPDPDGEFTDQAEQAAQWADVSAGERFDAEQPEPTGHTHRMHYGESRTLCGELGPDDTVTTDVDAITCEPCRKGVHRPVDAPEPQYRPVDIRVTTTDGERITYAHVPSGDPVRVGLFLARAEGTGAFKDITAVEIPESVNARAMNGHVMTYPVVGLQYDDRPKLRQWDASHSDTCPCTADDHDGEGF